MERVSGGRWRASLALHPSWAGALHPQNLGTMGLVAWKQTAIVRSRGVGLKPLTGCQQEPFLGQPG